MSKSKAQGTAKETSDVKRFQDAGLPAARLAEGGQNDKGDVYVEGYPYSSNYSGRKPDPIVGVSWKRLVKGGSQRRTTDGEGEVVVVTLDDFIRLVKDATANVFLECKATERLNVTRVLAKARKKVLG